MPTPSPTAATTLAPGRVVMARKVQNGRGMTEGRVWVEAYLPFNPEAFASFAAKAAELGTGIEGWKAAAAAEPELASKALTPIDSQGEAMLPADLELLADGFLVESRKVDAYHDMQARPGVQVVGSFLNTPEVASPKFWPGAWVVVLRIAPDAPEFQAVEKGELNAVSFMAMVRKFPIAPKVSPLSSVGA